MGKNIVELTGVNKIYGTNHVVKDLTLTVEEGEFLTLLGSSGCGKTTTLRMIEPPILEKTLCPGRTAL